MINFNIEGGPTLIIDVVSNEVYIKSFKMLQQNNLIFLDQILNLDKKYLLSIEELELKNILSF